MRNATKTKPEEPKAELFPPRGSGVKGRTEQPLNATWQDPQSFGPQWNWTPGKLVFGGGRELLADPDREGAHGDDRHIITIAGSRAGKSSTVLIPNLLIYPGSMIVLDPKGELARATAKQRSETFGQDVVILDPFGTSGWVSSSYDPLSELDPASETFIDDVGLVGDALIVDHEKDPHWTDAAKNVVRLIILFMFASGGEVSLPRMRRILLGAEGTLGRPFEGDAPESSLLDRMVRMDEFEGLLAATAQSFADKTDRELGSILSTAREQTRFLDSKPLASVLKPSGLRLGRLKSRPTTIYLCLPAGRLATHFRWLRLVVTLGLIELEKASGTPKYPIIFMLEEFAALQRLQAIERAAGFFAGFGVRMWTVLQDLTQLKTMYPQSWETFVGNAGMIQAFGNVDLTTTEYLSKLLGSTTVIQQQKIWISGSSMTSGDSGVREHIREVRLLDSSEISRHFARETNRQLLLRPGSPPIFCDRLPRGFNLEPSEKERVK